MAKYLFEEAYYTLEFIKIRTEHPELFTPVSNTPQENNTSVSNTIPFPTADNQNKTTTETEKSEL